MASRRLAFLVLLAAAAVLGTGSAAADDTNIVKDFNEVKKKGRAANKERAEFWAAKNVAGKDLYWLARLYDEAGEDEKAAEIYEEFLKVPEPGEKGEKTNREPAAWNIVQIHAKKRNWQKVLDTADRFQKTFPESPVKHESFDRQGRAHRMLGDQEKAAAAFTTAADLGLVAGAVNLADLLAANGKLDEAKATLAKYATALEAQPGKARAIKSLTSVKEMYDAIGKPSPSLDGAASVGREEAPKELKGVPSILVFWHMSWPGSDTVLQLGSQFQKAFSDKARVVATSTYNKFNPSSRKIEPDLSPEDEAKFWKQYLAEAPNGAPPLGVVVSAEAIAALHLDQPGQLDVVDAEGVIRYIRPADPTDMMYPWLCVQEFVDKLIPK